MDLRCWGEDTAITQPCRSPDNRTNLSTWLVGAPLFFFFPELFIPRRQRQCGTMEPEWSRCYICSLDCSLQHTWMCSALWRCQSCQGESAGCCCCFACLCSMCRFILLVGCVIYSPIDSESNTVITRGLGPLKMLSYWLLKRASCAVMYDVKRMSKWGGWGVGVDAGGDAARVSKLSVCKFVNSLDCGQCSWSVALCVLWCRGSMNVLENQPHFTSVPMANGYQFILEL